MMSPYQVVVEGVFVCVSGSDPDFGFHGTFYTYANSARNAVHRTENLLRERMSRHGIDQHLGGIFSTYYTVRDIWEVEQAIADEKGAIDLGFTLFSIGKWERYFLAVRRAWMRRFKPWIVLATP
jgi:hypothetical protein